MATDHIRERATPNYCPDGACRDHLIAKAAEIGVEVVATVQPPLVLGPYTTDPFTCPHGTRYWAEPTGDQIAQWARDGVR